MLKIIPFAIFFAILFIGAARSRMAYISRHAVDGDTVRAFWRGRWVNVRIRYMDAPELGQRGGEEAKARLEQLVGGRWVELDAPDVEKWGRTLAGLRVAGKCASVAMVRAGHAFAYFSNPAVRAAEAIAKRANVGVWRSRIVKPWEWRKK
jgi:endonuclease YncB( thermonuclease family)